MTDLQSLKNPQRITAIVMFLAVFVTAIGPEALGQTLPFIPQAIITGLVTACAWFIAQNKVENRVVRAEEIKVQEIQDDIVPTVDEDAD